MVDPLVSVGLVTYNRAHLLPRAIDSVLSQSFNNYELIISDDNSSDGTAEVVASYLPDHRVRYIKRKGIGMTQNFVQTLNDARGEYFIWLCDDDYFGHNYLRVCADFLSANSDYSLVCGVTRFISGNSILKRSEFLDLEQNDPVQRVSKYFRHVNSNIILYGMMRRKEIAHLSYPDTFCADLLWSAQVVFLGKIKIMPETSFHYSVNGISENTATLHRYYKTTRDKKINPYSVLRSELIDLVYSEKTVFNRMLIWQKIRLTLRLWLILRERFMMPEFEARVRGILRVGTKFKALFR